MIIKQSGLGSFLARQGKDLFVNTPKALYGLVRHPVKTIKSGYKSMEGVSKAELDPSVLKKSPHLKNDVSWATSWNRAKQKGIGGGAKELAEQASRKGWTGQKFKYLPVGEKALTVGMGAYTVPSAFLSKPTKLERDSGETRASLGGGEVGSLLGFLAGSKLGLPGQIASSVGLGYLGSKSGKLFDRLIGNKNNPTIKNKLPRATNLSNTILPQYQKNNAIRGGAKVVRTVSGGG